MFYGLGGGILDGPGDSRGVATGVGIGSKLLGKIPLIGNWLSKPKLNLNFSKDTGVL